MMKTEQTSEAKIKNFTPLLDELVQKYGVITASVWGRVWRYAQQDNKVCQASTEKIGDELGISRRTVIRHLQILVANGYLKDHSPNLKNRPHTYSITEKAHILITIEGVTESHSKNEVGVTESPNGVTESHSGCDTESLEETIKKQFKKELDIPENLNTEEFVVAWCDWVEYRKQIRKKLAPMTAERQLKRLAKEIPSVAAAMLNQSIENQWTGIFELKGNGSVITKKITPSQDGSINV